MERLLNRLLIQLALQLLKTAMRRELREGMPLIARRLQEEVPFWRRQGLSSIALEKRMAQLTSDVIQRSPEAEELTLVRLFADPLGTALKSAGKLL